MNRFFESIILVAVILFAVPSLVQAAGFTITPMLQEVILDDGETSEIYETSVSNETDTMTTFEISVIDFGSLDESGGVAFLGVTGEFEQKYALASWMQPEMNEVTLQPGETRTIKVRIENREGLAPGGHYGALVFKNVGTVKQDVPSVAINQIFTSLVFVKKTGGAKYGLELASVQRTNHWFSFDPKVTLRFKNPGNVHVVPRGEVRVTDPFGRLVYRGVVNEGSAITLPETVREYPLKLFSVLRALIPGYYTFDLSYRYDGREVVETWSERSFLIPPFATLLITLAIIGFILFFWLKRRKTQKRAQ